MSMARARHLDSESANPRPKSRNPTPFYARSERGDKITRSGLILANRF